MADDSKDYVDLGSEPEVEVKRNGVVEIEEKPDRDGLKPVADNDGGKVKDRDLVTDVDAAVGDVKSEITSLDLHLLLREMRESLIGATFRKIYQYGGRDTKQMIFGFHIPRDGERLLYIDNKKLFLTTKKDPAPQEPTSFCMFLRKHLMGRRIKDIFQHGFDRIIELHTADNILVLELFSKGNVILCDSSYNIIMAMEIQKWRHREIRPKVAYRFPPSPANPFGLDAGSFFRTINRSDKNLIATLATSLSLGPVYAKELCRRAGVEGGKASHSITAAEAAKLQTILLELEKARLDPCVYPSMVSPFPLKTVSQDCRKTGSFSDALDEFFSSQILQVKQERARKVGEKKIKKVENIAEKQTQASEKWTRIAGESREIADLINNYYTTVEAVINGIRKAKDSGLSWPEIKQRVQGEASPEAESIKEIREGDGIVVMDLGGNEVEIEFMKSPEENAARYFEDAKWAKAKTKGADAALEVTEKRLDEVKEMVAEHNKESESTVEKAIVIDSSTTEGPELKPAEPKKIKKRWYEFYRWFVSSDGLVVIAGKNATQNENIVKKRLEPGDLVFHSDIQGAAFVIIKSEGKTIPQETIKEASEFAAAHSKAWAKGLGKVDVFAAKPEQVSKANEQGVNAPKGAFFINGERSWFRGVPIKLAVGVWINKEDGWAKVIAGPLMPVRRLSQYFTTLRPGFTRSPELAASIKRNLLMKATPDDKYFLEQVPLEDFQGQIPSGMSDMIEGAGDF
jgi:predicted ribosome quality control (RQC) complex YloA/Tae2 family protein